MVLKHINLRDFRNFATASYDFNPNITIIIGENARGKTNLLESIYVSMDGEGFRESREDELVRWEQTDAYIESIWEDNGNSQLFQIHLKVSDGKTEKKFYVNKTNKGHFSYRQFLGKAVLFAPEHIEIVSGSPDRRRDYFNRIIGLGNLEYRKKLRNYEQALRKRNKVLEHHSDVFALKEELAFWNDYLIEAAAFVTSTRAAYVEYLNSHPELRGYRFQLKYLKNELTRERLDHYFSLETKVRRTMVGPQKDDFEIHMTREDGVTKNIHAFGSRSEQRLGIFWLKLAEIRYLEDHFKRRPILLLDDIFSELDAHNKKLVMELAAEYQTVMTTTEAELLLLNHLPQSVIRI